MSRKKKLFLNTLFGLLKQSITVICGFVLTRWLLQSYGSTVNGLISSISRFLTFISLLDMGVGSVIQANLYKPLAENDIQQISAIVKSSDRFFKRLSLFFIIYIVLLCFVLPQTVIEDFSVFYTVSLIVIISISTLAQYLVGIKYQLLLTADQKAYIPMGVQILTVVLNAVFAVILMNRGATIHTVKLMTATVFLLRPFVQMAYVNRHYQIDKKISLQGEPIKQKWNGLAQHVASVVYKNIDVVALTLFSTLKNISIYSVYFNVITGIELLFRTTATGIESLFGNLIAKNEYQKLLRLFNTVEWIMHSLVTIIFSITAITIVPFVCVYTKGIGDADYYAPLFSILLVSAYWALCLSLPYFRLIKAAGHFKQTQNGAYIAAALSVVITVVLVTRYGLTGVSIGTLTAMMYHTCYFVWYLRDHIINRKPVRFFVLLITDLTIAVVSYLLASIIPFVELTYMAWVMYALKVSFLVTAVSLIFNAVFHHSNFKNALMLIRK